MANQLIVGAGKFGQRFYGYLQSLQLSPISISKSPKDWSDNHIQLDLLNSNFQLPALPKIDQVYIILAPISRTEEQYQQTYIQAVTNFLEAFKQKQNNFHCTFLSATSVYGANQLNLINEKTDARADSFRGKVLQEAEINVKVLHPSVSIVRASGLYSSARQRLISSILDPENKQNPKWLNLIHEDDLCQWLYKASINQWPLSIASDASPFTRKNLDTESIIKGDSYREFRSIYLDEIQLSHKSFMDWLKCQ